MKFAVSIYSFMQYFEDGRLTPIDCFQRIKDMGFDAVEMVDFVFPEDECPYAYAKKLRAESDRIGLPISNYTACANLLNEDYEGEIAALKKHVDLAEIMGCSIMRHDVASPIKNPTWKGFDSVLDRLAAGCREITEYARAKGIRTTTENHGRFSQDSLRVEKLVNTVASDNFGLLVDMGNFLCADDDPVTAVGRCAPYAFYAHAKDFLIKTGADPVPGEGYSISTRAGNLLRGTIIGHGSVPVRQCLRALKSAGYDGWIAIEFEGIEDCFEGVRIGFANLKKYVAEVYGE
ncbi:MAG: sugar phosphate isomerase/epimerase [Oscillospiraceae bacterium]|nr:sugar phosphate isomerase/epimerase [Oscillospiraceae bacterium]